MKSSFAAMGLMLLVGGETVGCGAAPERKTTNEHGDAVVVDFYLQGRPSLACSGTLLSARVVLTAAHCADQTDGARVTVADAPERTAEVSTVLTYDWSDDVGHHPEEHDLALLVLRQPLEAAAYARLSTDDVRGQEVALFGRSNEDGRFGVDVLRVDGQRLATDPDASRPYAARVSASVPDAGGAVRRSDGALVGVVMGNGREAGPSYVTRVDERLIATWVDGVTSGLREEHGALIHSSALVEGPGVITSDTGAGPSGEPEESPAARLTGTEGPRLVGAPVSLVGYDRATQLMTGDPSQYTIRRGSNWWGAFGNDTNDTALDNAPDFADRHPEASFLMGHGNPGWMAAAPPVSQVKALYQSNNGGPVVLISCYGGLISKGASNAGRIADAAGLPRRSVYGCSGQLAVQPDSLQCRGRWVDGNGAPISRRPNSPLQNCTMRDGGRNAGGYTQAIVESCN